MKWISAHGEPLSIDDLVAGKGHHKLRFSVSFDDGYASVFENALPILQNLNIGATVYVNTGWISHSEHRQSDASLGHYPEEYFMSWDDVCVLSENKWIIGSHGVDHLDLTSVDKKQIQYELNSSKETIENIIKKECVHFAFTWGRYSNKVLSEVRKAGYHTASSAIHGALKSNRNQFVLPRIDISRKYSIEDFKAIIKGDWDFLGKIQKYRRFATGMAFR
jgi:peptidoglycan/xylan/chitin deacetylase (PgdA/CDA1 family)